MGQDREVAILEIAESMVRQGGYNGFSFRDIASAVGIKSSSVHYHFATKEELTIELIKYYTEKFMSALPQISDVIEAGEDPIKLYVAAYRQALEQDKGMCLCGMLGAEAHCLPELVLQQTRSFFNQNIEWLERAYDAKGEINKDAKVKARQTLSLLQGAMITSNTSKDLRFFDLSVELIL